jgi:hypothetical protein
MSRDVSESDLSFLASQTDPSHSVSIEQRTVSDLGIIELYGRVVFNEPHLAAEFIETTNHLFLRGQIIACEMEDDHEYSVRSRGGPSDKLAKVGVLVAGLPPSLLAEHLYSLFKRFNPLSSSVDLRPDGTSMETGEVLFASGADALAAVENMNLSLVNGYLLNV